MDKKLTKALKAYKNMDFINSGDARVIRILAELLEPMQRFRKHNINDTIVFFGSARTKSPEEAKKRSNESLSWEYADHITGNRAIEIKVHFPGLEKYREKMNLN